jgi:hypothetical protein
MGLTKALSKRLEFIEKNVSDNRFDFAVVVRSEEELQEKQHRIGPKTTVIHIKKAVRRVRDAIK